MIRMIAFDFDGTLAESVALCLEVFDRVFAEFIGGKAPSHKKLLSHFWQNEIGILQEELGRKVPVAEERFFALHQELHPVYAPEAFPSCRDCLLFGGVGAIG